MMNNNENKKEKDKDKDVVIIINGREVEFTEKKITFEELIELAFGTSSYPEDTVITVTYSKGPHMDKGSLVLGDSVNVKKGMIFNATKTTRS